MASKERQVNVYGEIDVPNQQLICSEIRRLSRKSALPIVLIIDSPGGKADSEEAIVEAIRNAGVPVNGLVVGEAVSAAFNILQACVCRFAYPAAQFMFHAPRISAKTISSITLFPAWFDIIKEDSEHHACFLELLAQRSGQPVELLREWSSEEKQFTALEAKRLGFIDEIVSPED